MPHQAQQRQAIKQLTLIQPRDRKVGRLFFAYDYEKHFPAIASLEHSPAMALLVESVWRCIAPTGSPVTT
jgi:hypothetical protein